MTEFIVSRGVKGNIPSKYISSIYELDGPCPIGVDHWCVKSTEICNSNLSAAHATLGIEKLCANAVTPTRGSTGFVGVRSV